MPGVQAQNQHHQQCCKSPQTQAGSPPHLSQPSDMGQGQRWLKYLLCFLQIHPQITHMAPSFQNHCLTPKIAMLPFY